MTEKHTLLNEFPQFKDAIHTLKTSDAHFRRLFDAYDLITTELHHYDDGAGAVSDSHAEDLKKKALALKDELYALLTSTASKKSAR